MPHWEIIGLEPGQETALEPWQIGALDMDPNMGSAPGPWTIPEDAGEQDVLDYVRQNMAQPITTPPAVSARQGEDQSLAAMQAGAAPHGARPLPRVPLALGRLVRARLSRGQSPAQARPEGVLPSNRRPINPQRLGDQAEKTAESLRRLQERARAEALLEGAPTAIPPRMPRGLRNRREASGLSQRLQTAHGLPAAGKFQLFRDVNDSDVPGDVRSEFLGAINDLRRGEGGPYKPRDVVTNYINNIRPAGDDRQTAPPDPARTVTTGRFGEMAGDIDESLRRFQAEAAAGTLSPAALRELERRDRQDRIDRGEAATAGGFRRMADQIAETTQDLRDAEDRPAPAPAPKPKKSNWVPVTTHTRGRRQLPMLGDAKRPPTPPPEPTPRDEDSWFRLGERLYENSPDLFKRSAGGLMWMRGEIPLPMYSNENFELARSVRAWAGSEKLPTKTMDELVRADMIAVGKRLHDAAMRDLQANAPNVEPGSIKDWAYAIAENVVESMPMIAVSLATRSPTAALAVGGVQAGGKRYGASRAAGRTPAQARWDAAFSAIVETIPEKIPLGIMMKPGGRFLPRLLKESGAEGIRKTISEILQTGYDKGILKKDMTWGEAWQRIKRAGIVGIGSGGAKATVAHPFVGGKEASK